ncbi:hypothetical protein PQR75_46765 [Paraburkholderia fungorum]|uniref:hypothetical protein n=1 Tax=Paraburkholderia fungorum TaxID=134537 RepID=UPI0038BD820E
MAASAPMPVDSWQADSTSQSVTLRVSAQSTRAPRMATGEYGFLMEPEQARQLIRDLSAAVLASDLKHVTEMDALHAGERQRSHESSPEEQDRVAGHRGMHDQRRRSAGNAR